MTTISGQVSPSCTTCLVRCRLSQRTACPAPSSQQTRCIGFQILGGYEYDARTSMSGMNVQAAQRVVNCTTLPSPHALVHHVFAE